MHKVGRIDIDTYSVVSKNIRTDEVIITDAQIEHIIVRHPEAYEEFEKYAHSILEDPDYILENRPNTALVLKLIEENEQRCQLVLRLCVSEDPDGYKNSVITFTKVREKEWNRLLRNKKILYKKA